MKEEYTEDVKRGIEIAERVREFNNRQFSVEAQCIIDAAKLLCDENAVIEWTFRCGIDNPTYQECTGSCQNNP